ncbi:MAG: hypothetical protein J1F67_05005 [Muribaculaceae bacterium]|nr:hypothetical protein [Muribaculaceae bacterium]
MITKREKEMEQKNEGVIEEIRTLSFPEALKAMKVGETKYAPLDCSEGYVRAKCSDLKSEGYEFGTRMINGRRAITRFK